MEPLTTRWHKLCEIVSSLWTLITVYGAYSAITALFFAAVERRHGAGGLSAGFIPFMLKALNSVAFSRT